MAPDSAINVVSAADDAFSMALAVTVRSMLDCLGPSRRVRLFVMDGGITNANRQRLRDSWADERLSVEWLPVPDDLVEGMSGGGRFSRATFFRILIPSLVPKSIARVVYLDADLLVRRDIGELWDQALDGAHCLAVQDVGAPYLDATRTLDHFERRAPWLAWPTPIPNFRELGLPGGAMYFNAGVILIDLARFRADDVAEAARRCLVENERHLLGWDQFALNVVLCGKWRPLDLRWNQLSRTFRYPSWEESPFDRAGFLAMRNDPYIVHFSSVPKPWEPLCSHPYLDEFRECLDRTAWKGVRPRRRDAARARSVRWASRAARGVRQCRQVATRLVTIAARLT